MTERIPYRYYTRNVAINQGEIYMAGFFDRVKGAVKKVVREDFVTELKRNAASKNCKIVLCEG